MPDLQGHCSTVMQSGSGRERSQGAGLTLCRARRYAIKYDPPTIILEYETPAKEKRLRSVKVQDVHCESDIDSLTQKVIRSFPRKLDRKSVSHDQVRRLVEKLVKHQRAFLQPATTAPKIGKLAPLQTSSSRNSAAQSAVPVVTAKRVTQDGSDSFGMSVDSIADAETDLNKLSVEELNGIKAMMDINFKKNLIRKDDPAFQYDVQKDFDPTEDNDWDDDDECNDSGNDSGDFEWPA